MADQNLVTAAEMREIEARAAERGETGPLLMDRAATIVAEVAAAELGGARRKRVLVLAGPGNNGGDGLLAGVQLRQAGAAVTAYLWRRHASDSDAPLQAATERGVTQIAAANDKGSALLRRVVTEADLVIDALLGAGLDRDISGDLAEMIEIVNSGAAERGGSGRPLPIVAVDVPTGISSDSGAVRGIALRATTTVTLGLPKIGLYQYPGASYAGKVHFGDIGVTDLATDNNVTTASAELVRGKLPERPADANKGTFGRVLIVAGSVNYIGAGALAALGAMRSGVGLATLATPAELLPIIATKLTETTFLPLPADMGVLIERSADVIFKALDESKFAALLVGPGIGHEKETGSFVRNLLLGGVSAAHEERAIGFGMAAVRRSTPSDDRPIGFGVPSKRPVAATEETEKEGKESKERQLPPLVIDADGLNALAGIEGWAERLPANSILTPHPGEMARLLGGDSTVESVQADRVVTARDAAAEWKQIVVLKGANTVVAEPGGAVTIIPVATAALASGGTGDVLAGVIVSLLAQGLTPYDAAVVGAFVHAQAGVIVERELGDTGVIAGDIAAALPHAFREIKGAQPAGA